VALQQVSSRVLRLFLSISFHQYLELVHSSLNDTLTALATDSVIKQQTQNSSIMRVWPWLSSRSHVHLNGWQWKMCAGPLH
jgi:hypothetical protein